MKKLFIAFNLLVLILLISSCGDILNPESDIHTTQIQYHSVLKDQEHSVIMPLKVGNIWVYKVSGVSSDGKTEFIGYDTILVKRDTIIKGEKWFIAKDPSSCNCEVVLTNTDVGLICNPECDCGLLRAEYPSKYTTYLYMQEDYPTQVRYYDNNGNLLGQKIVWVLSRMWIDVETINDYLVFNKNFVCYKYSLRAEYEQEGQMVDIPKFEPGIEYFVPDLGLVRKDFSRFDSENMQVIFKRMELIYTNVKI